MSVETEARTLGWRPQSEYTGDPEKWVDAETYVARGKEVMPILKANNRKLEERLSALDADNQRLRTLFQASQESIAAMQEVHTQSLAAARASERRRVMAELRDARESGDVETELQLTERLADLREEDREAKNKPVADKPAAVAAPAANQLDPATAAWLSQHSWFGADQRKTLRFMGIMQQLRSDPENDGLVGTAMYDKALEVMDGGTTPPTKVAPTKVTTSAAPGGSSYADLPAEAKAACDRQSKKLVGEGRAFKDMQSWQAYYAKTFFEGN